MLHIARVPIPFGTAKSSILTGIAEQARVHAERGGATTVVVADSRDARVPFATNLLVDYSRHCPREYFTRWDTVRDFASARLGRPRRNQGRLFIPAIEALREQAVDVVLLHEGHYALPSVPFWRSMWPDVRLLLYVNTPLSRTYGAAELRTALASLDGCIFVSEFARSEVAQRIGEIPCPSFVVHNGIDPEVFNPRDSGGSRPEHDRLRITFAGEIAAHKGPQYLIRAVARLKFAYRLRVIGGAPDGSSNAFAAKLLKMASRLGVAVEIEPRKGPAELAEAFRHSDVVVVPSVWPEPFGRIAPEAMACGAAVISSTWGGLPETCGGAARLLDPLDVGALVDALEELSDPLAREVLVKLGLRRASDLTWENSYRSLTLALSS